MLFFKMIINKDQHRIYFKKTKQSDLLVYIDKQGQKQ
jgi:hypothetical protein